METKKVSTGRWAVAVDCASVHTSMSLCLVTPSQSPSFTRQNRLIVARFYLYQRHLSIQVKVNQQIGFHAITVF